MIKERPVQGQNIKDTLETQGKLRGGTGSKELLREAEELLRQLEAESRPKQPAEEEDARMQEVDFPKENIKVEHSPIR